MSKPESSFIASVHRYLPPEDEFHHEKMANPYRGGTADVWYSGQDADLWIEYKFVTQLPVRAELNLVSEKSPMLSPLQQDWLRRRHAEGRHIWVVVGSPKGGVLMMGRSWEGPWSPEQLKEALLDRKALADRILNFTGGGP